MTATEWIEQARARCDAATDGPWLTQDYAPPGPHEPDPGVCILGKGSTTFWAHAIAYSVPYPWHDEGATVSDAEFIAAARTDLPRALDALRAVLAEHEPAPGPFGSYRQACAECSDPEVGLTVFYPCTTVRVIEEALA